MGTLTTIVGFAAGYILGIKRDAPPVKKVETQVRNMVGERLPRVRSAKTDLRHVRDVMTPMPLVTVARRSCRAPDCSARVRRRVGLGGAASTKP